MRLVIVEKNLVRINGLIDWLLHMATYAVGFLLATNLFKSVEINSTTPIITSFLIVIILYALNKTIKPTLVTLTIPITGLTLGLFYPCINLFMLKLVDWGMGDYFNLTNLYAAFIFAVVLSIMHFIADEIINAILKKVKAHE